MKNTVPFSDLLQGALFTNKHGHVYRKLPDACATAWRGTSDGKAGRAEVVELAEGFIAPPHFGVGTCVVIARNTRVTPV